MNKTLLKQWSIRTMNLLPLQKEPEPKAEIMNEKTLNKFADCNKPKCLSACKDLNSLENHMDNYKQETNELIKGLTDLIERRAGNGSGTGSGKRPPRFFGYNIGQAALAFAVLVVFVGGVGYVAVQNHFIGLVKTHQESSPYLEDKPTIQKHIEVSEHLLEKADTELDLLSNNLTRIETKLDIVLDNQAKFK